MAGARRENTLISGGAERKVEILTAKTAGSRSENTLISGGAERKVEIFRNNLAHNSTPYNNKYIVSLPRRFTIKS